MARLITANGFIKNDVDISTLQRMQKLVGGYIEFVYPREDRDIVLVCNEEGLLIGLPINERIEQRYGISLVGDVIEATRDELN
jgi:hypothetical protein